MNLRDSNERLLAENKKLLEQIKDHEAKEKTNELKGQEQLMEILKNQASSSSGRTPEREGEKKSSGKKAADKEEQEHQDVQTPESSEQDPREKTVIFADVLGDDEALQVQETVEKMDEQKKMTGEPGPKRSSGGS